MKLPLDAVWQMKRPWMPATLAIYSDVFFPHQRFSLSRPLQVERPGSWINCGGTGIGWSNGAALGVQMALAEAALKTEDTQAPTLVCQVVGDGSFMCAAPSSAL
jgi:thiamine pyrophosphate-dependent acetolactate synthase large subunit-like protein